jgi:hypothetical protein
MVGYDLINVYMLGAFPKQTEQVHLHIHNQPECLFDLFF